MSRRITARRSLGALFVGTGLAAGLAQADESAAAPEPALRVADDPNPYYLGASEGVTHDSNVYRVSGGPGDTYSSTSLLGGFDQPISRQRIFGNASVSVNRYADQTALDNTSYNLAAGASGSTILRLSGGIDGALNQNLAAPAASNGSPQEGRNLARTRLVNGHLRWGGDAQVTLEATAGYANLDYSNPAYAASNATSDHASFAAYYQPGGLLRLGLGLHADRTRSPMGLQDPATGEYAGNSVSDRSLDLLANYAYSGLLSVDARLSYTRQSNADEAATGADFSGLTGRLGIDYRATGRIHMTLFASRDAGLDTALFNGYSVTGAGSQASGSADRVAAASAAPSAAGGSRAGAAADTVPSPIVTPVSGLYENNRISDTIGFSTRYAASNKIDANVGVGYTHANLLPTLLGTAGGETTDITRSAFIGATYAITRGWNAACNLSHESRQATGAIAFSYSSNSVGCSARYLWR